jgi:hypothetical protein
MPQLGRAGDATPLEAASLLGVDIATAPETALPGLVAGGSEPWARLKNPGGVENDS